MLHELVPSSDMDAFFASFACHLALRSATASLRGHRTKIPCLLQRYEAIRLVNYSISSSGRWHNCFTTTPDNF